MPEVRPYYSAEAIKRFQRKREEMNARKRALGRSRDEVSSEDLKLLIGFAQDENPEVRAYGERGIREALTITGKAAVVVAVISAALKISELGRKLVFASIMADNIRRNVGLITRIPDSVKPRLARDIWRLARGRRKIDIARLQRLLMEEYNLSEEHSKIIAIDQNRKYQGSLAEAVQVSRGVGEYMWETMKDDRVRPSHRVRQGKIYSWKNPPGGEHPGEAINCRCRAIPIIRKK